MILKIFMAGIWLSASTWSDDNRDCLESTQQYVFCMKQEARYWPTVIAEEISDSYRKKVEQCFIKYACKVPENIPLDTNMTVSEKQVWNKFRSWWDPMSLAKKHCVINLLKLNFRPKLTACFSKQIPGFSVPPLSDDQSLTAEQLNNIKKLAEFRLMIERATYYCKGHELEVDVCIYELRRKGFSDTCTIRHSCQIDQTQSCIGPCYSMGEKCANVIKKIRPTVCKCATEGQKQNRKLLSDIEARSGDNLYGLMFPEPGNKISKGVKLCGGGLPEKFDPKLKSKMSDIVKLRVTEYMDAFGERDVTFCHSCEGQEI